MDHPPVQTEEDLFRRLDELELEEELNDELERLNTILSMLFYFYFSPVSYNNTKTFCRLHAEYEADYENNDEEEEGETSEEDEDSESGIDDENYDFRKISMKPSSTNHINESKVVDLVEIASPENGTRENKADMSHNLKNSLSVENSPGKMDTMKKNRRISFADENKIQHQATEIEDEDDRIYIRFCHSSEAAEPTLNPKLEAPLEKVSIQTTTKVILLGQFGESTGFSMV